VFSSFKKNQNRPEIYLKDPQKLEQLYEQVSMLLDFGSSDMRQKV